MTARMFGRFAGGALRSWALCGLALAAVLPTGCAGLQTLCQSSKPPTGPVCKIATSWNNSISVTNDTEHGGAPLRGLAGRLYLFGNAGDMPLSCEGDLIVDLYDDRPLASGGEAVRLERWQFPKEIVQQLLRKDIVGWGYTIFLPWVGTYRPDITPVHLMVCFMPRNGTPLYDSTTSMSLTHGERPAFVTSSRQEVPGH